MGGQLGWDSRAVERGGLGAVFTVGAESRDVIPGGRGFRGMFPRVAGQTTTMTVLGPVSQYGLRNALTPVPSGTDNSKTYLLSTMSIMAWCP